ncbi:MAG TPA: HypC/HybG/HupF family hydrogenase formation chaperone [Candidatus Lokiarchaeia archaeon]|nr:HypC/HybG/HupF family hydrogenase formation chaperone [Candidatus Lokiarchaeia archaeon]
MCIAVPVKVLEISTTNQDRAIVDYGGLKRDVSTALINEPVQVGDYVIIHAGCAIQRIDPEEAEETLALMNEMLGS